MGSGSPRRKEHTAEGGSEEARGPLREAQDPPGADSLTQGKIPTVREKFWFRHVTGDSVALRYGAVR